MNENKPILEKDSPQPVELYQKEVTDLLGNPPVWLIHSGSYLLYGVLFLLLSGAAFIHYPDVVKGAVWIDDFANVEWITAHSSGQIEALFVENDSLVRPGDTIGILQNTVQLNDVETFCRMLPNVKQYCRTNNVNLLRTFPYDLTMGELSNAYDNFMKAVKTCIIYDDHDYFSQRKIFFQKELDILKREPEKNELAILKLENDLFELSVSHQTEIEKNNEQLELAYGDMLDAIREWEENYVIRSNSEGRIVLGEVHTLTHKVNKGDTIGSVISNSKEEYIGRMELEQEQIAGIVIGNSVNIHLALYPEHTYGMLVGKVSSINFIPYNKRYIIDIAFPDQLYTTAKKKINYELGLKGEAEIITSNRSVLSRIFDPFRRCNL